MFAPFSSSPQLQEEKRRRHEFSERGLRSLFDKLYVPLGHPALEPELGRLSTLMKAQQEKNKPSQLKDRLEAQAGTLRAAKQPEVRSALLF